MMQAAERLLKAIISAHVFMLYYEVANNYARALKDEKLSRLTGRELITLVEHFRFIVRRYVSVHKRPVEIIVLFFLGSFENRSRLVVDIVSRKIRFIWKFFLARRYSSWKLFLRTTTDRVFFPFQHSFSKLQDAILRPHHFFTASIQRYIKLDPFFRDAPFWDA